MNARSCSPRADAAVPRATRSTAVAAANWYGAATDAASSIRASATPRSPRRAATTPWAARAQACQNGWSVSAHRRARLVGRGGRGRPPARGAAPTRTAAPASWPACAACPPPAARPPPRRTAPPRRRTPRRRPRRAPARRRSSRRGGRAAPGRRARGRPSARPSGSPWASRAARTGGSATGEPVGRRDDRPAGGLVGAEVPAPQRRGPQEPQREGVVADRVRAPEAVEQDADPVLAAAVGRGELAEPLEAQPVVLVGDELAVAGPEPVPVLRGPRLVGQAGGAEQAVAAAPVVRGELGGALEGTDRRRPWRRARGPGRPTAPAPTPARRPGGARRPPGAARTARARRG